MPIRSFVVALLACSLSLADARAAIVLPPPTAAELGTLDAASTAGAAGRRRAERVGFGREVAPSAAAIDGAALDWRVAPDGSSVARIEVVSTGAAALRVQVEVREGREGVKVRFASTEGPAPGVWTLAQVKQSEVFWSPILEGDRAIVVVHANAGSDRAAIRLAIPRISHLVQSLVRAPAVPSSGRDVPAKRALDLACHVAEEPLLADIAKSVVKVAHTDARGGVTSFCGGTLISNGADSPDALLYTAAHCGIAPDSVNVYWFYEAGDCGGLLRSDHVQLTSGARMLASDGADDWAVIRLREPVPIGARFAVWRAEPLPPGTEGWLVHSPAGAPMKANRGRANALVSGVTDEMFSGGGRMVSVAVERNAIAGGSSGGGFFTRSPDGSRLELRGAVWGHDYGATAYISRIDVALPLLRDLLTPDQGFPQGIVPVVEFWARGAFGQQLRQFITADPREIAELEAGGRIAGWVPGAGRFLAYAPGHRVPGTVAVCRFFQPIGAGAHFYSASEQECAEVARRFGDYWIAESGEAFRVFLPDPQTGVCPAQTTPVHRYFDPRLGSHQFTSDASAVAWNEYSGRLVQEGYGRASPDLVAMCAPSQ